MLKIAPDDTLASFSPSCLGHLIRDEAVSALNSPSTQHYFHYYLVDEEDKQIDSMGVLLEPAMNQFITETEVEVEVPRSLPKEESPLIPNPILIATLYFKDNLTNDS